ncbi:hypothetical protein BGX26_008309 [Mortierella sp. AD094]|nr:hypothetical protein BGX26_008309 [Mortierella sp. AD094]
MMSTSPIARLVSVANATKMFRALPKRTFTSSSPASNAKFSGFFNHNSNMNASTPFALRDGTIAARYNISRFAQQQQSQASRFFSSAASRPNVSASATSPFAKAAPATSSPFIQGQAIRGFSKRAWHTEHEAAHQAARDWHGAHAHAEHSGRKHMHEHWMRCGGFRGFHHHHHHRMMRRRRPVRFLFRMMFLSTVFIAVPAVVVFDAPYKTLAYVPLTVFGAGAALMLTGRLLFIALPVVAVGGAAAFWVTVMPSADTAKDLKKILKREENSGRYSTATSILGSDWEIQKAQPNEWFRWTFPERGDKKQLDKIDIRMTVFDPNNQSDRKEKSLEFMDKLKGFDGMENNCKKRKHRADCQLPENLMVKREGDQFLIQLEDDGEKLMDQKVAKKYLALGRIVDRAAKEMEAAQPGLSLGEQVVLVHKNKREDSFWSRWSPYGDLALRIPFNRTWVNDLNDL